MTRKEEQSETEWLHSQLELIASNRALKMWDLTVREYESVVQQHGYTPKQAIDFLKEKYEIEK